MAQRKFLDFDDLLSGDLTQRATEHGGVVRINSDRSAIDLAETGDHAIARNPPVLHSKAIGAVRGETVQLDERSRVEEHLDAFAGGRLAGGAPPVGGFGLGVERLVTTFAVLVDLLL